MLRILLTGKTGQIGWELQRSLAPLGDVVALGTGDMDLTSLDSIRKAIRESKPEIIGNAAGYTAVDKAEAEPDLAMQVNAVGPGVMAREARRIGALLVHYSTDYVFDGTLDRPYVEKDAPHPLNAYGESKLAGERAIEAVGGAYVIFRTSWVYAARGHNFVRTMLRLARERTELRVIDDQIGAPTWARAVAELTAQALATGDGNLDNLRRKSGLYHLTADGATSWFGFAQAILAEAKATRGNDLAKLIPVPASEYPAAARRPANSRLDNSRFIATFGLTPRPWNSMLTQCFREIPGI
jgi:dTDP-4-dehydrorhamnose reductase